MRFQNSPRSGKEVTWALGEFLLSDPAHKARPQPRPGTTDAVHAVLREAVGGLPELSSLCRKIPSDNLASLGCSSSRPLLPGLVGDRLPGCPGTALGTGTVTPLPATKRGEERGTHRAPSWVKGTERVASLSPPALPGLTRGSLGLLLSVVNISFPFSFKWAVSVCTFQKTIF